MTDQDEKSNVLGEKRNILVIAVPSAVSVLLVLTLITTITVCVIIMKVKKPKKKNVVISSPNTAVIELSPNSAYYYSVDNTQTTKEPIYHETVPIYENV